MDFLTQSPWGLILFKSIHEPPGQTLQKRADETTLRGIANTEEDQNITQEKLGDLEA